jgi:hypothetical protein
MSLTIKDIIQLKKDLLKIHSDYQNNTNIDINEHINNIFDEFLVNHVNSLCTPDLSVLTKEKLYHRTPAIGKELNDSNDTGDYNRTVRCQQL